MKRKNKDEGIIFSIHCIPTLIRFCSTQEFITDISENIAFFRTGFPTPSTMMLIRIRLLFEPSWICVETLPGLNEN
ncbi:hypothetical protein QQ054_08565 [Oscillatoria amoena NRMC-F 0135]|nr:hypothetical protein [Oscillatoria amoena NRMC-F 0135]